MFVVTFTNAVPQDSMLYFWGNDNETQCISSIMYKGDFLEDGIIKSGDTCTFIFDGSWFVLIGIDSGISSTTSWISLLEV